MGFKEQYRRLFKSLGYPLGAGASMPASTIDSRAKALDIVVPGALREFYLVAGREKRLNQCYNRLLAPKDWRVNKGRLIFMVESDWVLWWGVSLRNPYNNDPPVAQAPNLGDTGDEPLSWRLECRRCSEFLAVHLHYQAFQRGYRYTGSSSDPESTEGRLGKGWKCYGTVNRLTAYSRSNQVVCIERDEGVLAAGKTKKDLQAIEADLDIELS